MSSQQPVTAPPVKLTSGELPLTLTADVLRLPYPLATRVVLAEIVSLYAANGNCYCSDAHLAARLTIAKDTASVAVKLLVADGLLVKQVDKAAGNTRHLVPVPAAIAAKATANPYPEIPGRATRKNPVAYSEFPGSPTRKNPVALPGNSGTNTTVNTTDNLQEPYTPAAAEKKIGEGEFLEASTPSLKADNLRLVPPVAATPQKPAAPPRLTTYRDYDGAWPEQFPVLFDTPAFRAAWSQWGKYLDELGKPHRGHNHEKTDQAELGRMAAGSEQRAIEIITQSISAGWKRLIDHKPNTGNPGKPQFGQAAPTPVRAGGSPSQAAAYRPR